MNVIADNSASAKTLRNVVADMAFRDDHPQRWQRIMELVCAADEARPRALDLSGVRNDRGDNLMHALAQDTAARPAAVLASFLSDHNVSADMFNDRGNTPLDLAMEAGNRDVLNVLTNEFVIDTHRDPSIQLTVMERFANYARFRLRDRFSRDEVEACASDLYALARTRCDINAAANALGGTLLHVLAELASHGGSHGEACTQMIEIVLSDSPGWLNGNPGMHSSFEGVRLDIDRKDDRGFKFLDYASHKPELLRRLFSASEDYRAAIDEIDRLGQDYGNQPHIRGDVSSAPAIS